MFIATLGHPVEEATDCDEAEIGRLREPLAAMEQRLADGRRAR